MWQSWKLYSRLSKDKLDTSLLSGTWEIFVHRDQLLLIGSLVGKKEGLQVCGLGNHFIIKIYIYTAREQQQIPSLKSYPERSNNTDFEIIVIWWWLKLPREEDTRPRRRDWIVQLDPVLESSLHGRSLFPSREELMKSSSDTWKLQYQPQWKNIFFLFDIFLYIDLQWVTKTNLNFVRLPTFHARQTHYDKCSVFLRISSGISLKKTISVNQMNALPTSSNKLLFKSSIG